MRRPRQPRCKRRAARDVVHGQAGQWEDGLDPFTLTRRDDRLYGRGAADNKVQHLINILALEAVLAARGALGFNVTLLFEMGEEIGSPGLKEFCAANRELLAADVFIASDGPRVQADVPTLFMGARGGIGFELSVTKRTGAHHSGNWGGLLADPAIILSHALASITDARGQIQIAGWRPNSLTDDVRAALAALPMDTDGAPRVDLDWGEASLTPAERVYGWNSFAVLALDCGHPNAPQNAINATARAVCQLRFVVGTDMDRILPALREHLDGQGFGDVDVTLLDQGIFPATRLSMDNPWVTLIRDALEDVTGLAPHMLPNLAGSLPNDCFADVLGLPTVWVPHSYRGCNQHAPNEHALLSLSLQALRGMTGIWWEVGKAESGRG